jgi:hypothetical protein
MCKVTTLLAISRAFPTWYETFYFGHDFLAYIMVINVFGNLCAWFSNWVWQPNFLSLKISKSKQAPQFKQYLIDLSNTLWRFGTLMEVQFSKFSYMLGPFEVFPFYFHILILLYGWMFHIFFHFSCIEFIFYFL